MTARHLIPALLVAVLAIIAPLVDSPQPVPSDGPQFCHWLKSQGQALECPDWHL